jgi:hypothetical protein
MSAENLRKIESPPCGLALRIERVPVEVVPKVETIVDCDICSLDLRKQSHLRRHLCFYNQTGISGSYCYTERKLRRGW